MNKPGGGALMQLQSVGVGHNYFYGNDYGHDYDFEKDIVFKSHTRSIPVGNGINGVNVYGHKYGARNPNCPSLFFSYLATHDNDLLTGKTTDDLIEQYNEEIEQKKKNMSIIKHYNI